MIKGKLYQLTFQSNRLIRNSKGDPISKNENDVVKFPVVGIFLGRKSEFQRYDMYNPYLYKFLIKDKIVYMFKVHYELLEGKEL